MSAPRRVLHVINLGTAAGGAERLTTQLVAAQRAQGDQVVVLSSDVAGHGERFSDVQWPQARSGGPVVRAWRSVSNSPAITQLEGLVRDFQPTVVHLHTVGQLSPRGLRRLGGRTVVMTIHGPELFLPATAPWCLPASSFRDGSQRTRPTALGRVQLAAAAWVWGPMWRRALAAVDVFIAPSEHFARLVGPILGPAVVIPNACPGGATTDRVGKSTAEGPVLVYIGRLEDIKGVDVLLAALPPLLRMVPRVRLRVLGDGPDAPRLSALVRQLGLDDLVTFEGWCPPARIAQALRQADVLVVPSLAPESFGMTCLEGLQAGCPVVATDVGAHRELIRHEETGLLVPDRDSGAIASAVGRLLADRALTERLVANGEALARSLSMPGYVAQVNDAYALAARRSTLATKSGKARAAAGGGPS